MNQPTPVFTDKYRRAFYTLLEIGQAIVQVVKDSGPMGMPEGHAYAACMGAMTLEQFNHLVSLLVKAGKLKRGPNHTLHAV